MNDTTTQAPAAPAPQGDRSTFTFGDVSPAPNGPKPGPAAPAAAKMRNTGRQVSAEEAAAIQARRQATFERARAGNGQFAAKADEPPKAVMPPREDIESIELTLPDGTEVEYGPPRGVSLTLRMIDMLGDDAGERLTAVARTLLCIRKLNGKPPPPVANKIDVQKFANMLGDDAIDILYLLHMRHWRPLMVGDLPAIKKNLRQS
jgi:hypothetical protein